MKSIQDKTRAQIIDLLSQKNVKFNQLLSSIKLKSNELAYHLKILEEDNLICKKDEQYCLTDSGKIAVPYLKFIRREEIPPIVYCVAIVIRKNKIAFVRREKEPFKGILEFPGGKIIKGETIFEATARELFEETSIIAKNPQMVCTADVATSKDHHLIGFYVKLDFVKETGKDAVWLSKKEIMKEKLFDDNKIIISKYLKTKNSYIQLFYDEEKNKASIKNSNNVNKKKSM